MNSQKEVIIIGGGVSGLGMAVQLLRRLGHQNFTIYEKSDNIGGTWWHNRYPACACDIPSYFYSYSFDLKPDWTTTYPKRDELHDYFLSVAKKYDVLRRCRFNQMCLSLAWDDIRSLWICKFQNTISGEITTREVAVVISAVGTLDRPSIPEIAGATEFSGTAFHSARWDSSVDFKNKNVVVLGNGASATQFVPELVKQVGPKGKVTQLVKSAHWWTKRGNPKNSEAFKAMMKYVPFAARFYRFLLCWELDHMFYSFLMTPNGAAMRTQIRNETYKYIESDAPKEYREILKPSFEPGCKRRVNTLDYLKTLHSPNMHLSRDRTTRIGSDYIETENGERYTADVLIYATGFLTQKWLFPIKVHGVGGKDLQMAWDTAGGAEAYKGTVITDFPNFFVLYGPNAATGQHSVIYHVECQINYSCRLLRPVLKQNAVSIIVKPEAQKRDLTWVHSKVKNLVFNSGCQSWWMDPVTKKNTFIYPDPMYKYWLRTIFPTWSDFDIHYADGSSRSSSSGWMSYAGVATSVGVIATVLAVSNRYDVVKLTSPYLGSFGTMIKSVIS